MFCESDVALQIYTILLRELTEGERDANTIPDLQKIVLLLLLIPHFSYQIIVMMKCWWVMDRGQVQGNTIKLEHHLQILVIMYYLTRRIFNLPNPFGCTKPWGLFSL
jgi:hypothetical protein